MIAWNGSLINTHCSSWSIIQTLEWLNNCRISWLSTKRSWRLNLRASSLLLPDSYSANAVTDQNEINEVVGLLSEVRRWVPYADLRYCPLCIRFGMHYRHQQDLRFRSCMLHLVPLEMGCPECGSPIDTKGRRISGFMCSHCQTSVLDRRSPRVNMARRSLGNMLILDDLDRWEHQAAKLSHGYQRAGTGYATSMWGQELPTDCRAEEYWRAIALRPHPRIAMALEPASNSFQLIPTSPLSPPISCGKGQEIAHIIVHPYILMQTSVARYLCETILANHASCVQYAMDTIGPPKRTLNPDVHIHTGLCCLAQGYALWQYQWILEFRRMVSHLQSPHYVLAEPTVRLPDLQAAERCFLSSFEQWVDALAFIQNRYSGKHKLVILDGVSRRPHWALMQGNHEESCPIHFRISNLSERGSCDHGEIQKEELAKRRVAIMSFRPLCLTRNERLAAIDEARAAARMRL